MLVFNIFLPITISANLTQQRKLISFNSYIDVEYDSTPLNTDVALYRSINVPITIKYQTDVPENFLWWLPFWRIRNLILYGSMIGSMQKIHIEVIDPPDWADIYISQPDTYVDIPFQGSVSEKTTSLVISPREKAPAVPQSIVLKVSCLEIGRIKSIEFQETIPFTPAYVPSLTIIPSNTSVITPPNKTTSIPITIKNNGNRKTRIMPSIVNSPENYSIEFNPPFIDVNMDETGTINLEVKPPSNFQGFVTLKVDFTAERFPKLEGSAVGGPYSLSFELYYEPEDTEEIDYNPYLIIVITILIIIISFLIFQRYRRH